MDDKAMTHDELIEENAKLKVQVEYWKEKYESMKELYELVNKYSNKYEKEASELSIWKEAHSGNYRNAGRPKKFDMLDQGYSVYVMHDKEGVSYRKIADLLNMSYTSARRLYKEYMEYQETYGKK